MEHLTLKQLQAYLKYTYPSNRDRSSAFFMKLVEEIGELAEVLNEIEERKRPSTDTSLAKELADVIHYAFALASINDIDLEAAIIEKDKTASVKYNHRINLEDFLNSSDVL